MKTKIFILVSIMAILGAGLFALDIKGSGIAASGTLETVSGKFSYDGSEWTLETTAKKLYNIHFGNYTLVYPQGLGLKEGTEASVTGFVLNNDIAVTQITSGGSTYTLRDSTTGRPLWAGQGNRKTCTSDENCADAINGRSRKGNGGRGQMSLFTSRQGRGIR